MTKKNCLGPGSLYFTLLTTSGISRCGTFSPFLSLVILFPVLPSNFIVCLVKSSRLYQFFILKVILFLIFLHISVPRDYDHFLHAFLICTQNNLEYLIQYKFIS